MSSFSWLDYSEHERQRTLDAIDLFRERDTRDELGIGTVRDALADLLFPGTTTIQTRARYFLFVPWIYQDVERRRTSSTDISQELRRQEAALINALLKSEDTDGVVGALAGKSLKRFPSSIYWQGLATWGIRLFQGSQSQYHRALAHLPNVGRAILKTDDGDLVGPERRNWHNLPPAPKGFPYEASFAVEPRETTYLRERILNRCQGSLVAYLIDQPQALEGAAFVWELSLPGLPLHLQDQLKHAHYFSLSIWGAALLYNLMLAELAQVEETVSRYRDALDAWGAGMQEQASRLAEWNRDAFWKTVATQTARIPTLSRKFIDQWLDLALPSAGISAENKYARRLIDERERYLKRDKARLHNPRALEMWSGAAGTARLDYRWRIARTMISDILNTPAGA